MQHLWCMNLYSQVMLLHLFFKHMAWQIRVSWETAFILFCSGSSEKSFMEEISLSFSLSISISIWRKEWRCEGYCSISSEYDTWKYLEVKSWQLSQRIKSSVSWNVFSLAIITYDINSNALNCHDASTRSTFEYNVTQMVFFITASLLAICVCLCPVQYLLPSSRPSVSWLSIALEMKC